MKPLYPAVFKADEAFALKWAERSENQAFYRHIVNLCYDFPSLFLAWSGETGMPEIAAELSRSLLDKGINVFVPQHAVPLCAFSQAMGTRQMPLGLYLSYDRNLNLYSLAALTNHGGPVDEKDILDFPPKKIERSGVLGTTDYDAAYLNSLAGLADQFIEDGPGLRSLKTPFADLEEKMRLRPELKILFTADPNGLDAIISTDGQGLTLKDRNGVELDAASVCSTIIDYLVNERLAAGTVVGPAGRVKPATEDGEVVAIEGSVYDMNYHAAFADLLIGWWSDGTMAHQGSSCFGDALLSAIYYLEAQRS